ncbi:hypothetical protein HJ590_02660 [Naumannella sp. ID2617S]|nr:hypothetical protein [Naumannella sp. ID2617S]
MIEHVLFWPHPPLLLAEYASLADPGAGVRRAALALLDGLDPAARVVVLTDAPDPAPTRRTPLGERVARELLARMEREPAAVLTVAEDANAAAVEAAAEQVRTATADASVLLVLGDGSARRGLKAPGHLDERAAPLDGAIGEVLAAADPAGLRALDTALCAELLVAGRAPWQVAGAVLAGQRWRADRVGFDDPFGVGYHLARWTCAD